jgi:hypothetical protein
MRPHPGYPGLIVHENIWKVSGNMDGARTLVTDNRAAPRVPIRTTYTKEKHLRAIAAGATSFTPCRTCSNERAMAVSEGVGPAHEGCGDDRMLGHPHAGTTPDEKAR